MSLSTAYFGISVHDGKIGILDIGSNSVRLVIYDGMKRAPMPVFNEKAQCELGKNLARSGRLNPEGVASARDAIARYLAVSRIMDVVELYIIATAAVRDAEDGRDFVRHIEETHSVKVRVISGKLEAKLAAKGVQASLHEPDGLVGDLGGGSFELVHVSGIRLSEQTTLPLGALRLMENSKGSVSAAADRVRAGLSELSWLKELKLDNFYAVGGSFRSLAHMYLLKSKYPLEVLHAYSVKSSKLIPYLRKVSHMGEEEVASTPGSASKRAAQLPFAAVALAELLEYTGAQQVVFSTAGIREGLLFDQLSPYLKQEDGLIACCVDLASQNGRLENYPRDLYHWMEPLFAGDGEAQHRLRFACCLLSEFAWRIHPQYRAEWQFTRIIQSSFIGVSHEDRVALALALYHRHRLKTELVDSKVLKLLSRKRKLWCQMVGQAMSLGFSLSGGVNGMLGKTPLVVEGGTVRVATQGADVQSLMTDSPAKKLEGLGETFNALLSRSR